MSKEIIEVLNRGCTDLDCPNLDKDDDIYDVDMYEDEDDYSTDKKNFRYEPNTYLSTSKGEEEKQPLGKIFFV